LVLARFFHSLSFSIAEDTFTEDGEVKLFPDRPISQVFTAQNNRLNQVDLAIRNFNTWNRSNKISFALKDSDCNETIATDSVDIFSPDYTIYTPFVFSEIQDSQGKTYCTQVTLLTDKKDQPEELLPIIVYTKVKGPSFTNSGEQEDGADKIYKGKTLVMKPSYGNGSVWKDLGTLGDRISQYKPWFLKHYYIDTIVILFILFSIAVVTILILI
jgi:hypothetical protein